MNKLAFLLFFMLVIVSCRKDSIATGSIFVQVENNIGNVMPNAQVSLSPGTITGTTNALGNLLINDVEVGIYEVTATHPSIGSGMASAAIKENDVVDVTVKVITGTYVGPTVYISQPFSGYGYHGEELVFKGTVNHNELSPSELTVVWSSNIDGELNMDPPSSTGLISFLSTDLSEGDHTITVKVTDNESRTAEASIELSIIKRPDAVVLDEIEITDEGLLLNWSAYTHDDFESYRVLRIYYQAGSISHYSIDEIYDINTTIFLEDGYLELGETFYYRVDVVVTSGARSESNIQEIVYDFEHIDVETSSISRMLDDPSRAYLYVLDNENNELLFINKDSKTVEKSIFVGSFPNDMDMNDDYSKLYVANNGSSLVSVIDLNTQEKIQDLQVETQTGYDDNPLSIVWLKGDYIAYTIKTYGKIRIANAQTGALINASTSTQGQLLETNSTHDKVFTSTTNGLTVFEFENGHLIETSNTSNYSNYYNSIFVTDDDAHVFFGTRKFPTNNLDILLGTFDQTIGAINSDGSIAVGNSKIYNGNTFATIRLLPFSHSVKLITSDDKTLFYFEANRGKLYFTELE